MTNDDKIFYMIFRTPTHLSEIVEHSKKEPVIIFKYSNSCITSERLKNILEKYVEEKKLTKPIFLVTVQIQKQLSKNIEDYFSIKHESPQVILLNKRKVVYHNSHNNISIPDLLANYI